VDKLGHWQRSVPFVPPHTALDTHGRNPEQTNQEIALGVFEGTAGPQAIRIKNRCSIGVRGGHLHGASRQGMHEAVLPQVGRYLRPGPPTRFGGVDVVIASDGRRGVLRLHPTLGAFIPDSRASSQMKPFRFPGAGIVLWISPAEPCPMVVAPGATSMNNNSIGTCRGVLLSAGTAVLAVSACGPVSGGMKSGADVEVLVEAERSFARAAADSGVREAFGLFLSDSAVLFLPHPVVGRGNIAAWPPGAGWLAWEPAYVGVSSSGDLAFSTGPFMRRGTEGTGPQYGHFLSMWGRGVDGAWRVDLDHGVGYGSSQPFEPMGANKRPRKFRPVVEQADAVSTAEDLLMAEREFVGNSTRGGAVAPFLHPEIRLYRSDCVPVEADEAIDRFLHFTAATFEILGTRVSAAGDLGYTYGTFRQEVPDRGDSGGGAFTRVWIHQDGRWQVLIDLMSGAGQGPTWCTGQRNW
jgi:ketosteroid isomerase-like protein